MKRTLTVLLLVSLVFLSTAFAANPQPETYGLHTRQIERWTGYRGTLNPEEQLFKISVPRNDLTISVNGAKLNSLMDLVSWVSFKKINDQVEVSGDLVLSEDQVNPVINIALKNGMEVTSLTSHYMWESMRVMFLHIEGRGDEYKMAKTIGKLFAKIKSTQQGNGEIPIASINPEHTHLTTYKIDTILKIKGKMNNGVYHVPLAKLSKIEIFPTSEELNMHSTAAFAGTDHEAFVNGDLTVPAADLQKTLIALRAANIDISSIIPYHNPQDQHFALIHYWGIGPVHKLAMGLHNALKTIQTNPIAEALSKSTWGMFQQHYCPIHA